MKAAAYYALPKEERKKVPFFNRPKRAIAGPLFLGFMVLATLSNLLGGRKPGEAKTLVAAESEGKAAEANKVDRAAQLDTLLTTINEYKGDYESAETITLNLVLQTAWASVIKGGLADSSATIQAKAKKAEAALKKHQAAAYPKMRKAFVKLRGNELWSKDIDVTGSGTNILYTGGIFAANKNKQEMYGIELEMLERLRFKRISFAWYKGGEITYWDIDSPPDTAIE